MKRCSTCKQEKAQTAFHRNRARKDGRSNRCIPCQKAAAAAYYERNKERITVASRAYYQNHRHEIIERTSFSWTKRMTGVSKEEYLQKLEHQQGKCAICGMKDAKRRLAADHDHETGAARGLLCRDCNQVLGKFQDSPERFLTAAAYLRKWKEIG